MGFSAPDVVEAAAIDRVFVANEVEVDSRDRRHANERGSDRVPGRNGAGEGGTIVKDSVRLTAGLAALLLLGACASESVNGHEKLTHFGHQKLTHLAAVA